MVDARIDSARASMLKLAVATGYCMLSLLFTSFVMVIVHDR